MMQYTNWECSLCVFVVAKLQAYILTFAAVGVFEQFR